MMIIYILEEKTYLLTHINLILHILMSFLLVKQEDLKI